jgi:hypothetical protein
VPALVAVGAEHLATPLDNSQLMAKLIPGARLEIVAGAAPVLLYPGDDVLWRMTHLNRDFHTIPMETR